jgi:hypothetical protein
MLLNITKSKVGILYAFRYNLYFFSCHYIYLHIKAMCFAVVNAVSGATFSIFSVDVAKAFFMIASLGGLAIDQTTVNYESIKTAIILRTE